jgi:hypothetical protein
MKHECKKCLLLEAGEKVTYEEIRGYILSLPAENTVSDEEYNRRLAFCRECDNLISGMCLKCGCYVEVRAKLKDKGCPDENDNRW